MEARKIIAACIVTVTLQACSSQSGVGFRLPRGDPERGREAFVALQCTSCHRIDGVDTIEDAGALSVALGGHTVRVETYGDLVTSIVNPSHELARGYPRDQITRNGESLMAAAYLNDVMTVQELVDIVAFLALEYENVAAPAPAYWEQYPSFGGPPWPTDRGSSDGSGR